MATILLILHGLLAVALLGAITHQALATFAPAAGCRGSFFSRFRAIPSASFVDAIILLYAVSAILGAVVYFQFGVAIKPALENSHHWKSLGLFDLKEHFVAIAAALLPAYRICWAPGQRLRANTLGFHTDSCFHRLVELSGRSLMNNILGFGL